MNKQIILAGLIYFDTDLLIVQRTDYPYKSFENLWDFASGVYQNKRMDIKKVLKQNLKKELNIEVEIKGKFDDINYFYPDENGRLTLEVNVQYFMCEFKGETKPSSFKFDKTFYKNVMWRLIFDIHYAPKLIPPTEKFINDSFYVLKKRLDDCDCA